MKDIIIDLERKGQLQINFVSLFMEKTNMVTHNLTKAVN